MPLVGRTGAIVAGVFGALFIGYCIYFDRKRRAAPDFKIKLRESKWFCITVTSDTWVFGGGCGAQGVDGVSC